MLKKTVPGRHFCLPVICTSRILSFSPSVSPQPRKTDSAGRPLRCTPKNIRSAVHDLDKTVFL